MIGRQLELSKTNLIALLENKLKVIDSSDSPELVIVSVVVDINQMNIP